MQGTVSPKSSDQPKVSARDLKTMDAPANLQYRASGIKTFNQRSPSARQARR